MASDEEKFEAFVAAFGPVCPLTLPGVILAEVFCAHFSLANGQKI